MKASTVGTGKEIIAAGIRYRITETVRSSDGTVILTALRVDGTGSLILRADGEDDLQLVVRET